MYGGGGKAPQAWYSGYVVGLQDRVLEVRKIERKHISTNEQNWGIRQRDVRRAFSKVCLSRAKSR
jgi:hypothetical protein